MDTNVNTQDGRNTYLVSRAEDLNRKRIMDGNPSVLAEKGAIGLAASNQVGALFNHFFLMNSAMP
jgi:hypothetical protein